MKRTGPIASVLVLLGLGSAWAAEAPSNCVLSVPAGPLDAEFVTPPQCAKPRALFYTLDLSPDQFPHDVEAMSRSGLIGLTYYHAGASSARMKSIPRALSNAWMNDIRALMRSARDNGMEFSISLADCNGSGGPWITEEYAAKKLVYSESQVDGPAENAVLPPAVGPNLRAWEASHGKARKLNKPTFYRDVAVLAFREAPGTPMRPAAVSASSIYLNNPGREEFFPATDASDRDPNTCWKSLQAGKKKVKLEKEAKQPSKQPKDIHDNQEWLQHSYLEPIAAVGAVVVGGPEGGPWNCELQASDDEKNYKTVSSFVLKSAERKDLTFSATAKHFRLLMTVVEGKDAEIAELCLLRKDEKANLRPGNQWWKFKTGSYAFACLGVYPKQAQAALAEEYPDDHLPADVKLEDVLDLTDKVTADGKLNWKVPPGRWTILRFGYNVQGAMARNAVMNVDPPLTEVIYEVDVLSPKVSEYNFNTFAKPIIRAAIEETGKPPAYFFIDSYEGGASGAQGIQPTWTDDFAEKFKVKRGYDLRKYLPVMAHRLVDSRDISDRFLWDFRRTIADLWADSYERLQTLCEENGTQVSAQCGYGTYPYPHMDGLMTGGRVGLPQGEFWCQPWEHRQNGENYHNNYICDYLRNAASAAHVYGHSLLTAETLTCTRGILNMAPLDSPNAGERNGFKTYLDDAFTKGFNAYQILAWNHTWDNDQPIAYYSWQLGWATMGRQLSWIKQAPAWHMYVARCQSLLRRGWPVADVGYFTGEGSCSYNIGRDFLHPAMAEGFEYDGINTEVLLTRSRVTNGRIELSGDPKGGWDKGPGMSYALLVFPDQLKVMSPVLLARVKELIEAGSTVICPKPEHAPGLGPVAGDDGKLKALADAMWGPGPVSPQGEKALGKGRLVWGKLPGQVLEAAKVAPDVELRNVNSDPQQKESKVKWGHRVIRAQNTDLYFIVNQGRMERNFTAVFRAAGRKPEFFDPVTGEIRALPEFAVEQGPFDSAQGGRTAIPLKMAPYQSGFVVFRPDPQAKADPSGKNFPELKPVLDISQDWQVSFDPKLGGPKEPVPFAKLEDWTQRPEDEIKYYSGMAVYRKTFDAPGIPKDKPLYLDLGNVKSLAEVAINGKELGVIWCHPMRVAIPAGLLKASDNRVEIRPVNPWNNRMIGDGMQPKEKKVLKYEGTNPEVIPPSPRANNRLMPAGLMGPVRLMTVQ